MVALRLNPSGLPPYESAKELEMLTSIANSSGFGSGIDTAGLIADLASASRTPNVRRFDAMTCVNQAKVGTLAQARSDLDNFAQSLAELASGETLRSQPVTSDDSAIVVTSSADTLMGSFIGEKGVGCLAKALSGRSRKAVCPNRCASWRAGNDPKLSGATDKALEQQR